MTWGLSFLFPGDGGISQTVSAIRTAVAYALRLPEIRAQAEQIVATAPERDERAEVSAIFRWTLDHFRYLRDPAGLELVKSPEVAQAEIARQGFFQGDCDDVTAYLAALLKSIGYNVQAVTISLPGRGHDFRHIFPQVYLSREGRWLALEATAKKKPIGFEGAAERRQTYPL